jgi:L-fucose isomerase-like protein
MLLKPRVGSYAVYEPPEEGWQGWEARLSALNIGLRDAGIEVIEAPEAVCDPASCERVAGWFEHQKLDALHALIITWSFDHYTIQIQQHLNRPVAIRSLPGIRTGSLVGGMQLNNVLGDIDYAHKLFYGALEQSEITEETIAFLKACAIQNRLRGANIAVIGRRTEGMTPTAVDELEILRLFGVRLLNYGLDEFKLLAAQITSEQASAAWQAVKSGARQVLSTEEHGLMTMRNYLALKELVQSQHLSAIAMGSYPQCLGTMCLPLALLTETGFPGGCEGDVNSTLAMLILSMLTEQPVHFGEMLEVNEDDNTLVTSHCGSGSPALADEKGYILCPVRLANNGVCIRFTSKPGQITYVNLVGRKGNYRMCALQGKAIPTEMVFEGNPLRFILQTPFRLSWKKIVEGNFGHHWMSAYAHVASTLQEFCKLTGILGVFPDLEQLDASISGFKNPKGLGGVG